MHQSWERNDPIHLIQGADREARGSGFYRCTFPALPSCPRCYLNPSRLPPARPAVLHSEEEKGKKQREALKKKRRPCKFLCSYRAVISFCFPLKNQVSPYRFLAKINSCFLKSISEVESRGGEKKKGAGGGKAEKPNLSSCVWEERKAEKWTYLTWAISCTREGRKHATNCVHEEICTSVISDLQLSPCVSAAKKLLFNVMLSSSMLHVSGSEQEKAGQTVTLFNCLGTPWQLKSPCRLSISTYGRSERVTPPEPQAQAHTLSPCQRCHFKTARLALSPNLE